MAAFWMPVGHGFLRYLKQYPKIPPFLSKFASEAWVTSPGPEDFQVMFLDGSIGVPTCLSQFQTSPSLQMNCCSCCSHCAPDLFSFSMFTRLRGFQPRAHGHNTVGHKHVIDIGHAWIASSVFLPKTIVPRIPVGQPISMTSTSF